MSAVDRLRKRVDLNLHANVRLGHATIDLQELEATLRVESHRVEDRSSLEASRFEGCSCDVVLCRVRGDADDHAGRRVIFEESQACEFTG